MACENIVYSARSSGNTTQLLRHSCVESIETETKIDPRDFEKLKKSGAKFVCLDLRPLNAIECPGLKELVSTGFELGQKYPTMTKDQFLQNFPCRKTVKGVVNDEACSSKAEIKMILREAIDQNGLGCTLDLWKDKYKSNTYMAMTANVFLLRDTGIELKRVVLHLGMIPEIVKSQRVIKLRIIEVFDDYAVSEGEIRDNITFTTDR